MYFIDEIDKAIYNFTIVGEEKYPRSDCIKAGSRLRYLLG
jgi:hypothetical protein